MPLRMSVRPTASHTRMPEETGISPFQDVQHQPQRRGLDILADANTITAGQRDFDHLARASRCVPSGRSGVTVTGSKRARLVPPNRPDSAVARRKPGRCSRRSAAPPAIPTKPGSNVAATISRFRLGHARCRRRLFVPITVFVDTSSHHTALGDPASFIPSRHGRAAHTGGKPY